MVVNAATPGTVGPYDAVTVDNLTMNQNACANYPVAGTVSMRSRQSGKTGVVTFTGACDGSYQYSER